MNPIVAGSEDKRLEIDLEGLREDLWEYANGDLKDDITDQQFNKPRWIDTTTMIVDPLTKFGGPSFESRLVKTMMTGWLDLVATPESTLRKMQQQKLRMNKILSKDLSVEEQLIFYCEAYCYTDVVCNCR